MDHQPTPRESFKDPAQEEGQALLGALRRALRAANWTQARLADEMGVGSATMKRWLHGKGLSFQTLERLCALAGLGLSDLVQESRQPDYALNSLTLAQEAAMTEDPGLSTVFFLVLNQWPPSEAVDAFHLRPDDVERHVERLIRLALIDRLPSGRLRARLDPAYVWQREPMRRHFERHLKQYFLSLDFGRPETIFGVEMVKVSPVGAAQVREKVEQFRSDLRAIAKQDRRTAVLPAEWYAVLAVARRM